MIAVKAGVMLGQYAPAKEEASTSQEPRDRVKAKEIKAKAKEARADGV